MNFLNTFILLVDNLLKDEYNKPISKEEYLTFFKYLDTKMMNQHNEYNSAALNITTERKKWGRIKYNGKMLWKLEVILKTLLSKQILSNTGYVVNGHAKRYYYSEQFINVIDITKKTFLSNETINNKLYESLKKYTKNYDPNDPQYLLLMSDRFSIDTDKCFNYLISELIKGNISKTSCMFGLNKVADIHSKNIYFVQIDNGRIYTTFNSLRSELRDFCYIDGETLNSLDLKSSQPLLFASYMYNKYPENKDVVKFYNIVTTFDVYEWLDLGDRKIAKTEMFSYLFKKSNKGTVKVDMIMKDRLPELHKLVKKERKEFSERDETLANHLQSIEADIFISVQQQFGSESLSVHDSLYFRQQFGSDIRQQIESNLHQHGITRFNII